MATQIIPTLDSEVSQLTKPVDIIKYVIRHFLSVPKNINDTFADDEISFRYLDAQFGGDKEKMTDAVTNALTSVLNKYFPTATVLDITVNHVAVDEVRYTISIDVFAVINGESYSITQDYGLDDNGNLKYNFEGE